MFVDFGTSIKCNIGREAFMIDNLRSKSKENLTKYTMKLLCCCIFLGLLMVEGEVE